MINEFGNNRNDPIEKLEKASIGKNYLLKIIVQTRTYVKNRLFDIKTDVKIIKSLELQTKELMKTQNNEQVKVLIQ